MTNPTIPTGWKDLKLSDITSKISDGLHSTPQYVSTSNYHFINGNNLNNDQIFITNTTKCVSEDEYLLHKKELDDSTILLSINGTIGNVAYYKGEKVILGKSAAYINCSNLVDKRYIFYFLKTNKTQNYFASELTGSTIKNLSLKSIKNTKILAPPLPEQSRIVAVLETWDKAIEKLVRKIEVKKNVKKGLMQKLLTGQVRLPGFSEEWLNIEVSEVFSFLKTYAISRENLINGTSNIQGVGNIHYGDIHSTYRVTSIDLKNVSVPSVKDMNFTPNKQDFLINGDLIMADTSEDYEGIGITISVHGLEDKKVVGGLHTYVLRDNSKKTEEKYRQYIFQNHEVRSELKKIANGVSVYGISKSNLSKIRLNLPPVAEQTAIANILTTADSEIEMFKKKLALLEAQKKYLLNNLVTGQIRLPEFVESKRPLTGT